MKKKKSKLIGGILLMILGLGVTAGSAAFRVLDHSGMGPFRNGASITNRHFMGRNYNYQNPHQGRIGGNPNSSQPSTPDPNQNSTSK